MPISDRVFWVAVSLYIIWRVMSIRALPALPKPPRSERVLGIFPDLAPLDFSREKKVLRESGGPWQLTLIEGSAATRLGIVRELREGEGARLLYFASHGTEAGIRLSEGDSADREWLPRIVRQFAVECLVLNACRTKGLASACVNAGAKVVLVVDGEIEDTSASYLGALFVEGVASGGTAQEALDYALAAQSDGIERLVVLRGDRHWRWGGGEA